MQDQSSILSLPLIQPSQAQKHVTHNEALRILDVLVQLAVIDRDRTSPPDDPAPGDRHIVGAGATGAWSGADLRIAIWEEGGWGFLDPRPGWRAEVLSEARALIFDGTGWVLRLPELDHLPGLGLNTASDAANRLAVAAPATLLTHEGAGHQLKVNKAAAVDTASLLFQTGFSGRAEMGLAGNDDWSIKVSPDGDSWIEALRVEAASGRVAGQAVQSFPADSTAGRLMAVGAFGLGAETPSEITDFTAALRPGFYRYAEATATGAPGMGATFQGMAVVTRSLMGGTGVLAMRMTNNPASQRLYLGTRTGETGGLSWVGTWHDARVEGAANTNGTYLKLPDGTLICHHEVAAGSILASGSGTREDPYQTAVFNWTYPAAFSAPPRVTLEAEAQGVSFNQRILGVNYFMRSATALTAVRAFAGTSVNSARDVTVMMTAIGRAA